MTDAVGYYKVTVYGAVLRGHEAARDCVHTHYRVSSWVFANFDKAGAFAVAKELRAAGHDVKGPMRFTASGVWIP